MRGLKILIMTLGLTLFSPFVVKADPINYNLLYNWSKQPANVQNSLARQGVTITVAPYLDWQSNDISETWAYTRVTTLPDTRTITSCQIKLALGHEDCLTHEVGHALSNYNNYRYFWTDNQFWDTIYLTESRRQTIFPQGWQNKYEYFACCYEEYLRFPTYMQKLQPSSYNYIKVVMSYQ